MMVKISKSKKGLNFPNVPRHRPLGNCIHLPRIHGDTFRGHKVPEELNRSCVERTLLNFAIEVVLLEVMEGFTDMLDMKGDIARSEDEYIIKVGTHILV